MRVETTLTRGESVPLAQTSSGTLVPVDALRLAANGAWCALSLPDALRLRHAIRSAAAVRATQEALLLRLLRRNTATEFGRRFGFARIRSAAEYQQRVPLTTYETYEDAVRRIGEGERRLLTEDAVLLLEPTSGSAAATKHIPYTASLKREFGRAIGPWIVDLFRHDPHLLLGQAYWSVTPVVQRDARTPGGLPIGFEEDGEYLGALQRRLAGVVLAVPPEVRLLGDMDTFRYATLLFLLRSRALALISVWSPTFLTLLVARLRDWWQPLADDVAAGTLKPPRHDGGSGGSLPSDLDTARVLARLAARCKPDLRRAEEIRAACAHGMLESDAGAAHRRLWPRLRLISCWTDAQAAPYAATLARLFPQAHLQPKGLVATEGIVSFPLAGEPDDRDSSNGADRPNGSPDHPAEGAVLAVRSHFFEFVPVGSACASGSGCAAGAGPPSTFAAGGALSTIESPAAAPLLAHQLERGGRYSVVLTTGGGLYRYRLHDLVEVTGFTAGSAGHRTSGGRTGGGALLRFLGKEAHVSDHFGEKLNERHVRLALERILAARGVRPAFAMIACQEANPSGSGAAAVSAAYTLFVEAHDAPDEALRTVGGELETALQDNYHYRYCRDLRQLGSLRVFRVTGGALESYAAACQAHGQRAGDVKPTTLHHRGGWSSAFRGRWLSPPE